MRQIFFKLIKLTAILVVVFSLITNLIFPVPTYAQSAGGSIPGFRSCSLKATGNANKSGSDLLVGCLRDVLTFVLVIAIFVAFFKMAVSGLNAFNPFSTDANPYEDFKRQINNILIGFPLAGAAVAILSIFNPAATRLDFLNLTSINNIIRQNKPVIEKNLDDTTSGQNSPGDLNGNANGGTIGGNNGGGGGSGGNTGGSGTNGNSGNTNGGGGDGNTNGGGNGTGSGTGSNTGTNQTPEQEASALVAKKGGLANISTQDVLSASPGAREIIYNDLKKSPDLSGSGSSTSKVMQVLESLLGKSGGGTNTGGGSGTGTNTGNGSMDNTNLNLGNGIVGRWPQQNLRITKHLFTSPKNGFDISSEKCQRVFFRTSPADGGDSTNSGFYNIKVCLAPDSSVQSAPYFWEKYENFIKLNANQTGFEAKVGEVVRQDSFNFTQRDQLYNVKQSNAR